MRDEKLPGRFDDPSIISFGFFTLVGSLRIGDAGFSFKAR
jgi:hypothetical protein